MTSVPLHTFVVPAHGQSPHLADCLASLQRQTRVSKIVIATATPFDGLAELAERYGARLVINPSGGGIGRDWNFALSQSQTPWVTLAHQDDIYLPGFAEKTMALATLEGVRLVLTGYGELLRAHPRKWTPMLLIKRGLLELGFIGRQRIHGSRAKLRLLRLGCPVPCPSVTLRLEQPPMQFAENLRVNLDWDAWYRLALQPGAFAYERTVLMLHRIHGGSETSGGVRDGTRAREDLMMFEKFWPSPVARLLARTYSLSYVSGESA